MECEITWDQVVELLAQYGEGAEITYEALQSEWGEPRKEYTQVDVPKHRVVTWDVCDKNDNALNAHIHFDTGTGFVVEIQTR